MTIPPRPGPEPRRSPSRAWRRRVVALCVVVPALLLLAEGVARGVTWMLHGTSRDRDGYSDVFLEHHPRLGWLGVPGRRVRHRTTEFDVEIAIDALGLRRDEPHASEAASGSPRVALLGDSFVFGQGVREEERLGDRLAARVPGLEVVSVGLPAWGTDQALLAWSELDGPHATADVVVFVYVLEQVVRNGATARLGRAKPRFVLRDGELELVGVPVPAWSEGDERRALPSGSPLTLLRRHSRLYALLSRALRDPVHRALGRAPVDPYPQYAGNAPEWRVTRALLAELQRRARARGAETVLAIVPERRHLAPAFGDAHQRAVLSACAELGLPALDLTPALRLADEAGPDPVYFAVDGHWTAAGHAVGARELERFLRDAGLLEPREPGVR